MSEVCDGFGSRAESESNRERLGRMSVSELGRALIEVDGSGEHYREDGSMFRAANWPDPEAIGKHYVLEQTTRPAGSFGYGLRVFSGKNVVEWYLFQDGVLHVRSHASNVGNVSKKEAFEHHRKQYERAADHLRAALVASGYIVPLAPRDAAPGAPITETDNQTFLDLVAGLGGDR